MREGRVYLTLEADDVAEPMVKRSVFVMYFSQDGSFNLQGRRYGILLQQEYRVVSSNK
jgi:hypothetical protein